MKEKDIRPQKLLEEYIRLSQADAQNFFLSLNHKEEIPCVACGSKQTCYEFDKNDFSYVSCITCGTLYQSPRPPLKAFEEYYKSSDSERYWAEVFFPSVAEIRREKIFKKRVLSLSQKCEELNLKINKLVDVGSGYGIFLEEWEKKFPSTKMIAVEPSVSLAKECRKKGFEVLENTLEELENTNLDADLVVCFEVLEHTHNPLSFIKSLVSLAKPGGYIMVSTLCIDGFDLQLLWEKSNQINPPHHINFISKKGFQNLFDRAGLVNTSIATPGVLDGDIVINSGILGSNSNCEKFIEKILKDPNTSIKFQDFLQQCELSSHAWIFGQKRIN